MPKVQMIASAAFSAAIGLAGVYLVWSWFSTSQPWTSQGNTWSYFLHCVWSRHFAGLFLLLFSAAGLLSAFGPLLKEVWPLVSNALVFLVCIFIGSVFTLPILHSSASVSTGSSVAAALAWLPFLIITIRHIGGFWR